MCFHIIPSEFYWKLINTHPEDKVDDEKYNLGTRATWCGSHGEQAGPTPVATETVARGISGVIPEVVGLILDSLPF